MSSGSSPLSSSPVEGIHSAEGVSEERLAEFKAGILEMVSAALANLGKESGSGSATGRPKASGGTSSGSTTTRPPPQAPLPRAAVEGTADSFPATPPQSTAAPLVDGSAVAAYIAAASPFAPDLDDRLRAARRQVQGFTVGDGVNFPSSSNIGLSKEEKAAVTHMQESFKIFRTILQLCARMAIRFPEAAEDIEDIAAAALVGMRTQLRARDDAWMRKALPAEALPAFRAFEGSSILGQDKERFFSALKFAALKQQATKPAAKPGGKWKGSSSSSTSSSSSSSSSSKGKKPYFNKSSGQGAGPSATQN